MWSVDGVTVSIVAFQAAVPGSTPGQRILFLVLRNSYQKYIIAPKSILFYYYYQWRFLKQNQVTQKKFPKKGSIFFLNFLRRGLYFLICFGTEQTKKTGVAFAHLLSCRAATDYYYNYLRKKKRSNTTTTTTISSVSKITITIIWLLPAITIN